MKLTPRFTIVFIIYAAALLLGVGLLAYNTGRDSLRSNTISELEGTALRKESNLNMWVANKQADLGALANDPGIVAQVTSLMIVVPDSAEFQSSHDLLIASIQPRLAGNEFLEVSLIHPETGEVIASTTPDEEGTFKDDQQYFLNGKTGPYVDDPYYSDSLQSTEMTASSPLYAADGKLLGVLAAQLDVKSLNTVISRRTNLHETDDAYLVSSSNIFLTQPRLVTDSAVLRNGVHTEDVNDCLRGESGVMEVLDYRNVPSFVAYRWVPDQQLCLIVKIDQAEAYGPINRFGRTIAAISVIALLIAAALAVALARTMTKPIVALQGRVARFANGELDLRLDETSHDELGELAAEFNRMAEALTEQQTHLRRRAEQFFNLTLDLLCTMDSSGQLRDLNPAWENVLGYPRADLKGQLLVNLLHPDDLAMTTSALQRITQESRGLFENRCRHRDGQYRWLAWVIVVSTQDHLLYAAARDVTERRLAEEKLRQQTEELARSNRELEQFAFVASHDLQEPLRLVSNYVQLLARRYQGKLDETADEFIDSAVTGANRMKRLLADLQAYSNVTTQGREFVAVELEDVFSRAADNLRPVLETSSAIVTHDPLPAVLADNLQMLDLFENLIGNAVKFHGSEPPRVHIGASRLGEKWLIFVRDNGIGIDPRYAEQIFGLFQRFHNQDQYPGTGIGLAISRRIIERHGGRIWVDSEPGKGTTFYFTLQPVASWVPETLPTEVLQPRKKDTVADRATDLI